MRCSAARHARREPPGELGANLGLRRLDRSSGHATASLRVAQRAALVEPGTSHHEVPGDVADTRILRAAVAAGVDYLVTNDRHLLGLDPYEGVRIISMDQYYQLLANEGHIRPGS